MNDDIVQIRPPHRFSFIFYMGPPPLDRTTLVVGQYHKTPCFIFYHLQSQYEAEAKKIYYVVLAASSRQFILISRLIPKECKNYITVFGARALPLSIFPHNNTTQQSCHHFHTWNSGRQAGWMAAPIPTTLPIYLIAIVVALVV